MEKNRLFVSLYICVIFINLFHIFHPKNNHNNRKQLQNQCFKNQFL